MNKKLSGLIIGTPNESEFSNNKVLSEKDNPIILKLYGKNVDIDIDFDNNVLMNNMNSLIQRGKELIQEFENNDETIKEDKNIKCLRFFIESLNLISITSKQLIISANKTKIIASQNLELLSKDIKLGSLENLDNLNISDEENLEYDYVLSYKKFNRWWKNAMKPFINKINEFENKYNLHTHSGIVPPPIGEDGLQNYHQINNKATTSEGNVPSKTTKVI